MAKICYVVVMWTPAHKGDPYADDQRDSIDLPPRVSTIIYDTKVEAEAAMYRLLRNGWYPDRLAMEEVSEHNLFPNRKKE